MTILEGNTLIEKFMYPNEIIGKYRADTLEYHESWNKIMEVVIAITILGKIYLLSFGFCVLIFVERVKSLLSQYSTSHSEMLLCKLLS